MRVILVHNRYQRYGGEDAVFDMEANLLRGHGHEVREIVFDNADIPDNAGTGARLRLAASTLWNTKSAAAFAREAERFGPDVCHIHNDFPLGSPSVAARAHSIGLPVVKTIHNYRLACASAILYRDGHPCEDCLGRLGPLPGIAHACYRDSRGASAVVATNIALQRTRRAWKKDVDLYIAPTEFAGTMLLRAGGIPRDRVMVKPHFVDPDPSHRPEIGTDFLYLGRLTEDKGVRDLVETWDRSKIASRLRLVGDGPLAGFVRNAAARNPALIYSGPIAQDAVFEALAASRALIVSTRMYETFGLGIVQAFALGRPVIAPSRGSAAELVEDGVTGVLFDPDEPTSLVAAVRRLERSAVDAARMGDAARTAYERRYTAELNHDLLISIYQRAIELAAA